MQPGIHDRIYDFIERQGLRRTAQRDAIISAAFSTTDHYTADDLLARSRQIEPSVSRATIYRTLPLLVASGLLRELDFGREFKFYDPNYVDHPGHNHLLCLDCDRIVEFEDRNIDLLEDCVARRLGFSPANKVVQIEAHCDEFQRSGHCTKALGAKGSLAPAGAGVA